MTLKILSLANDYVILCKVLYFKTPACHFFPTSQEVQYFLMNENVTSFYTSVHTFFLEWGKGVS